MLVARSMPVLAKDTRRNLDKAEEAMKKDGRIAAPEIISGGRNLLVEYPGIARLYAARNVAAGRPAEVRGFHQLYWLADELALWVIDGEIAAWDLLRTDGDVTRGDSHRDRTGDPVRPRIDLQQHSGVFHLPDRAEPAAHEAHTRAGRHVTGNTSCASVDKRD